MKWRPRRYEESESWPATYSYEPERSPELAEVLARLEAATRLRDPEAAARVLDRMAQTEDGMWLLHQCAAAGLREVAARISEPQAQNQPSPGPTIRSIGAA